ncbi:MAG: VWA domain-containing protein [Bdellovibrionales bacterium]|nr:VWA domain-containing protein [Bdellovibrionales bacterium]
MFFRQKEKLKRGLGERGWQYLTSSLSLNKRKIKIFLEGLAILFFILALARPQSGKSTKKVKSEGVDLMMLVDVSRSMMAEDVRPSRLDLAKKELIRFIDMGGGDRIGIIAFAGSAALLSPVTTDSSALKMYIESLSEDSVSTQGTDFKRALEEAKSAFKNGGKEDSEDSVVTRVVLIASDGEDNQPGALEAATDLVQTMKARIFTMAFGTEKGGAIPVRDDRGVLRGYRKDKQGKVILSRTKGTILKSLAQAGKGSFHHITIGSREINKIRSEINALEKSEFESADMVNYDEKFQWFLILGLLVAFIEVALSERKKEGRLWFGRFEEKRQ